MKTSDIKGLIAADPPTSFAAKLPSVQYGRPNGSKVFEVTIVMVKADGVSVRRPGFDDTYKVRPAAVLDTWNGYVFERDHAEAVRIDRNRDDMLRYEAERAKLVAWIESWLPAFSGLEVPITGTSNQEHPPVDLADEIRKYLVTDRSQTIPLSADHLGPVAARIREAQAAALDAGGGWGNSNGGFVTSEDTGVATVHPLTVLKAKLAEWDTAEKVNPAGAWSEGYLSALDAVKGLIEDMEA